MKKHKYEKLLSLPVELYQREFYVRLHMALKAAKRGYSVIIGEVNQPVFKSQVGGVVFYKDHATWTEKYIHGFKSKGVTVCALDEEGLIIGDKDRYIRSRVSEVLCDELDIVFAWGEHQKNILINKVEDLDKICIVGSPKFDLCRLEKEHSKTNNEKKIKNILINTRFSLINGIHKEFVIDSFVNLGYIQGEKEIEEYKEIIKNEKLILQEFLSLLKELSYLQDIKVTIRPHPAESDDVYVDYATENIIIDRNADLREQILNADIIIHDACTTGIEANVMGKVVISLRPPLSGIFYDDFANSFSINYISSKDLAHDIKYKCVDDFNMPDVDSHAEKYISNWGHDSNFSSDLMLNAIDNLNVSSAIVQKERKDIIFSLKENLYKLFLKDNLFSKTTRFIFHRKYELFMKGRKSLEHKFANLDSSDVEKLIVKLTELDDSLLNYDKYKVEAINGKSFIIKSIDIG